MFVVVIGIFDYGEWELLFCVLCCFAVVQWWLVFSVSVRDRASVRARARVRVRVRVYIASCYV